MIRLSVILCAHNPREASLSRVLEALDRQSLEDDLWELLVVDNASSPPLEDRLNGLPGGQRTRVVVESTLGLTAARLCGFRAARGEVLVLIDDDTVPREDYLANALRLMEEHPHLGVMGGRIQGEFEVPPAPWASAHLGNLALRNFGEQPIRALIYNECGPWEPCGAGMVIRRTVALRYAGRIGEGARLRLDRIGRMLSSCGDTDLARTASDMGLYQSYEPELQLTHLIPRGRLTLGYLMRISYSIQRDGWMLYRLRGKPCTLSGSRFLLSCLLVPFRSVTPSPRRWLLNAAEQFGRLRGRWQKLGVEE